MKKFAERQKRMMQHRKIARPIGEICRMKEYSQKLYYLYLGIIKEMHRLTVHIFDGDQKPFQTNVFLGSIIDD